MKISEKGIKKMVKESVKRVLSETNKIRPWKGDRKQIDTDWGEERQNMKDFADQYGEKMNKQNYWKIGAIALLIALIFGGGFFLGRKTIKVPEKPHTVYIELPAVHDTTEKPVPVKEKLDSANFIKNCIASGKFNELFPEKVIVKDSIIYLNDDDYKKIAMDWATERIYEETAFDSDTLGKFDYTAKVQYNQLMSFGYNYTPLQKQQEIVQNQIKHFSPFIGAGISTLPSLELDLGAFIDDSWGFSFNGRYNMRYEQMGINKFDVGVKVLKKF